MNIYTKSVLSIVVCALALLVARIGFSADDPAQAIERTPATMSWTSNPALPPGVQIVVLAGSPQQPGPYVMRVKIPPNSRIAPHSHPDALRMVTVLSGTLYFAFGNKFDESKLKPLPPGTFFTEPKDTPHYALTKDEEVIVQADAIGPSATKYVDTSEDPAPK